MRTITHVGSQRAHRVVVEAELLEHARREVLDHHVAARDRAAGRASRPSGWPRSSVMPALAEVRTRGTAPTSRRTSGPRCGRTAALNRMPSGRCTASTLITSAPIAESHAVAAGPAQNAVKSSTFTPASGRSPAAPARRRRAARVGHACAPIRFGRRDQLAVGHAVESERRARPDPRLARLAHEHVAVDHVVEPRELGAVADDRRGHTRAPHTRRRPPRRCARRSTRAARRSPRRRAGSGRSSCRARRRRPCRRGRSRARAPSTAARSPS